VLRALDTVEDDVSIPTDIKSTMLKDFHTYLLDPDWKYMESTEKDKIVLEDFPVVCFLFGFDIMFLSWLWKLQFYVKIDFIYLLVAGYCLRGE